MTLVTAFQVVGPIGVGHIHLDPDGWGRAVEMIWGELQAVSRRLPGGLSALREEAASMVFARVFEQGPRGRRPEDPQSDAGVRGWLYRAVRNQAIDMVRAGRRDVELTEDMSQCAVGGCRPDDDLLAAEHERARAELAREIASARCELQQDIARTIATSLRADARSEFELTVQDLFALRDEILTVDAIVRRQRGEVTTRTRNAIYQRLSRARRRLADAVETIAASAACSPRHADILRAVVRSLGRQD